MISLLQMDQTRIQKNQDSANATCYYKFGDTKEVQMDTNTKTSSMRLAPPTRATTSSAISVQEAKHVHLKVQLLILFEHLSVKIILSTDLSSESLFLAPIPL